MIAGLTPFRGANVTGEIRHLGSILEVGGREWVAHLCASAPPPLHVPLRVGLGDTNSHSVLFGLLFEKIYLRTFVHNMDARQEGVWT